MALNPLAPVIEMMRYLLLGRGEVHAGQYLCSTGIAFFLLLAGIMIFQRTERTFIDTV
jgi:lipopolysaccharide transport system permease protein